MSQDGWKTVLVLGGIRSGKSEFAESLVADAPTVRYVATTLGGQDDPEWLTRIEEHQRRRPQSWTTEETGPDPTRLTVLLAEAKPDETLLVDDLGGWVAALLEPARQPNDDEETVADLATAVRECAARLVLVSPEVGLSLVPPTPVGRAFVDALGTANQALAAACDRAVLVVAGTPTWLKPGAVATPATPPVAAAPVDTDPPTESLAAAVAEPDVAEPVIAGAALRAATMALPLVSSGLVIQAGMDLPLPDEDAGSAALDRLATLDLPGAGLGRLERAVEFAAATQGTATPRPWRSVRVLVLHGQRSGGAAAGTSGAEAAQRIAQARDGQGALAQLAARAGADLYLVEAPPAGAMEDGPVLDPASVDTALRHGWQLAEQASDAGDDALVLACFGTGAEAASAAIVAATTGAEPVSVLARVVLPGGAIDDAAWMRRCAAVRDAVHRVRRSPRGPKDLLAELAGGDIAVATGVLLGAAARKLPVLLDGPVGVAAGLISRDLAGQARHWCLLPDHGHRPAVRQAAEVLGLEPLVDLNLDLGEGATALAALPLLRAAIGLAGTLPVHPALAEEFVEPEPDGPGPASTRGA